MGIKGIYTELGKSKRVALSKLSADCVEKNGRPLRLAVDFAIWQFQNEAARGGTNPALRTLFYRLARLMATPVQPIFVFDGPEKPIFKRNKRSGRGDTATAAQAKRLIRLFGFEVHDAPGEAEAECALLQKHGIVDAVLSEDVDTIMFGCKKTLRKWSAESKSSKTPTHVTVYDVDDPELEIEKRGLDREGMVLVALMSGGDYLPDGIPGCGVKVACEAAKAGFGKSICRLKASDKDGLLAWRTSLIHELHTNESGYFRTRHKALSIPEDFPNIAVLRYYTHPVVSPASTVEYIKQIMGRRSPVQIQELREFARETFGWDYKIGAIKFIRVLTQPLLVQMLLQKTTDTVPYVKKITARRKGLSTDGTPELRVSHIPEEIVPIDLSEEAEETIAQSRDGLALNSDDEFEATPDNIAADTPAAAKVFDVSKPDLAWVLESVVRKAAPEAVSAWEEAELLKAARKSPKKKKQQDKSKKATSGMPRGAMDQYVRVSKKVLDDASRTESISKITKPASSPPPERSPLRRTPPRQASKPPQSSAAAAAAGSPRKRTAQGTIASSQVTPRKSHHPGGPETIIISSSPAPAPASSPALPSSPPASPTRCSPRYSHAVDRVEDVPRSIRSLVSDSSTTEALSRVRKSTRAVGFEGNVVPSSSQGRSMKQTSLDSFAKRLFPPSTRPTSAPRSSYTSTTITSSFASVDAADDGFSSDLEPVSSLVPPTSSLPKPSISRSPHKRNKSQSTASPQHIDNPPLPPQTKKKLFVPRDSAEGFFKEIEVDGVEERDGLAAREIARLEAKGFRGGGVTRFSDVSVVDLTQDDA